MTIQIPKFKGFTYEKDGGGSCKFLVIMLGDDEITMFQSKLIFDTKLKSIEALQVAIFDAVTCLSDEFPFISKERYINMKTNQIRRFDKKG